MAFHHGTPVGLDRAEQIHPHLRPYLGTRRAAGYHFGRTTRRWRAPLRSSGTARCHCARPDGGQAGTRAAGYRTALVGGWKMITWPPVTDPPYPLERVIEPVGSRAPQPLPVLPPTMPPAGRRPFRAAGSPVAPAGW